jgi:hypothetical protein
MYSDDSMSKETKEMNKSQQDKHKSPIRRKAQSHWDERGRRGGVINFMLIWSGQNTQFLVKHRSRCCCEGIF